MINISAMKCLRVASMRQGFQMFQHHQKMNLLLPKNIVDSASKSIAPNVTIKRCIHSSSIHRNRNETQDQRHRPSLFFVQNPLTWIMTKLDFIMLKNTWDPSFNEQEFRIGTKQAVCTITQLVAENNLNALEGLLTRSALAETRHSIETGWSDEQRRNVAIAEEDIQVAVPRKVYFRKEKNTKFCDVDMVFLAVKPDGISKKAVIFIEINARFQREYSEFSLPDWTVCVFKMPRFKAINTSKK